MWDKTCGTSDIWDKRYVELWDHSLSKSSIYSSTIWGMELWFRALRGKDAPRPDFNYAEIVAFAKFIISGQRMESMLV